MVLPDRVSGVLRDVASGIVAASLGAGTLAASRHNSLPHKRRLRSAPFSHADRLPQRALELLSRDSGKSLQQLADEF